MGPEIVLPMRFSGLLIFTLILLSFPGRTGAEELFLKNGDRISGKIWRITRTTILIQTPYLSLSLPRDHIQKIVLTTRTTPVRIVPVSGEPFSGWLREATEEGLEILRILESEGPPIVFLPYNEIREVIFFEDGYKFSGTDAPFES